MGWINAVSLLEVIRYIKPDGAVIGIYLISYFSFLIIKGPSKSIILIGSSILNNFIIN